MKRRGNNTACLQEMKWKGKRIDGYKFGYTGEVNKRNGIGIVVNKDLKDKIVDVEYDNNINKLALKKDN